MSDAMWDMEYSKAQELRDEITAYCKSANMRTPEIKERTRSWELEKILADLKQSNSRA